jgi:hypothetical protein
VVGGQRPTGETWYSLYGSGRAAGSMWAGVENFVLTAIRSPDRPGRRNAIPVVLSLVIYIYESQVLYCVVCYLYMLHVSSAGNIITYRNQMNRKISNF